MSTPYQRPPREGLGRPPLVVVLPLLAFLALFAAWSAVWYEGTRRAELRLDEWLASEADRGRFYDCEERRIGGYPFRVEVDCLRPTADLSDATPQLRVEARRLLAVAMVWQLEHVIVEIEGPLRVENPAGSDSRSAFAIDAEWSMLQSSLRVPRGQISHVDMVIENARIAPDPDSTGPVGGTSVTADRIQIHQRQTPEAGSVDLAMNATGLVVAHDRLPAPESVDLVLLGRLVGLPSPMPRQPADFAAAWRANQGAIEIADLQATQGDSVVRAEGRVAPDAQGRPEGTVTISLAGPDVTTPGAAGAFGGFAPVLATALRLAGRPADLDGRSAVAGDLELRDGRVYFGPFPIAELPAIF
jgi:hypothetical protein